MVLIILITMNNRKEYFMRHLTVLVVLLALLSGCNIDENTKNMTTTEVESKTVESINEEAIHRMMKIQERMNWLKIVVILISKVVM